MSQDKLYMVDVTRRDGIRTYTNIGGVIVQHDVVTLQVANTTRTIVIPLNADVIDVDIVEMPAVN